VVASDARWSSIPERIANAVAAWKQEWAGIAFPPGEVALP